MNYTKLFLFGVLVTSACAAPVPPAGTQTSTTEPTSSINTLTSLPTASVTPDPAMGQIAGNVSWRDGNLPINHVNLEINGHSGNNPRYTARTDLNGDYTLANIEPNSYGFGIYFNIPLSDRRCEYPEFSYNTDLDWLHYATWLKGDLWYDIIFSNKDVLVKPGEVVTLDFELKCT